MKVTTGVDMIEVQRIKEAICKLGDSFLNRVYTKAEIDYCSTSKKMAEQHYAARFAAKEAIFKALSSYLPEREGLPWNEIEILNDVDGRPWVNVERLQKLGLDKLQGIDISISHIKEYAVASAVAMFAD